MKSETANNLRDRLIIRVVTWSRSWEPDQASGNPGYLGDMKIAKTFFTVSLELPRAERQVASKVVSQQVRLNFTTHASIHEGDPRASLNGFTNQLFHVALRQVMKGLPYPFSGPSSAM